MSEILDKIGFYLFHAGIRISGLIWILFIFDMQKPALEKVLQGSWLHVKNK